MNFKPNMLFLNCSFDKKRLKALLLWFRLNLSENAALKAVEILQGLGFRSATQGAISLGLDDLKTPTSKGGRVFQAQIEVALAHHEHHRGNRTPVELFQHLVDTWHRTSQDLTTEVVQLFHSTERVNPVYMMAFSGARGNISQVRQLVGMRGLMADPRGQIVGFPILSNFREGLTITEYFVSCYGARKGVVDTAIRTADAGYLTRRLADVSHHVVVRTTNCGTHGSILLRDIKEGQKTILSLANRLVGRVLAEHIFLPTNPTSDLPSALQGKTVSQALVTSKADSLSYPEGVPSDGKQSFGSKGKKMVFRALRPLQSKRSMSHQKPTKETVGDWTSKPSLLTKQLKTPQLKFNIPKTIDSGENKTIIYRNSEITSSLASKLAAHCLEVPVRSPLSCSLPWGVCQLCYGWGLSEGRRVTLGEAVGIIAAQSIGEPGTQLTLRTFHTGGVFSGELLNEIRAPYSGNVIFPTPLQGLLLRTPHGQIAFLTKVSGKMKISKTEMHFASKIENLDTSILLKNLKGDSFPSEGRSPSLLSEGLCEARRNPPIHSSGAKDEEQPQLPTSAAFIPSDREAVPKEQSVRVKVAKRQGISVFPEGACVAEKLRDKIKKKKSKLPLANLSKQDAEFLIQPSTVIFVKQKEHVINNQLLAEFSSSTLQSVNDQIEITQQVLSETAGQIWFKEIEYGNRKGPGSGSLGTYFSSQKLGGIWVLSGKPMIGTYPNFARSHPSSAVLLGGPSKAKGFEETYKFISAEQDVSLPKSFDTWQEAPIRSWGISRFSGQSFTFDTNAGAPLAKRWTPMFHYGNELEAAGELSATQALYPFTSKALEGLQSKPPYDPFGVRVLGTVVKRGSKKGDCIAESYEAKKGPDASPPQLLRKSLVLQPIGLEKQRIAPRPFVGFPSDVKQGTLVSPETLAKRSFASISSDAKQGKKWTQSTEKKLEVPSLSSLYDNKSLKSFIPLVNITRGKQRLQKIFSVNIFIKTSKTNTPTNIFLHRNRIRFSNNCDTHLVFNNFVLSNLSKFPKINESLLKSKNLFNYHAYGIQNRLKRYKNTRYAKTSTTSIINLQNNYGVLKYDYVFGYSQATSSKKHIPSIYFSCEATSQHITKSVLIQSRKNNKFGRFSFSASQSEARLSKKPTRNSLLRKPEGIQPRYFFAPTVHQLRKPERVLGTVVKRRSKEGVRALLAFLRNETFCSAKMNSIPWFLRNHLMDFILAEYGQQKSNAQQRRDIGKEYNNELNSKTKIVNHLVMKNNLDVAKKRVSIPLTTGLCHATQFSLIKRRLAGTPIYTFQLGFSDSFYFDNFYDLLTQLIKIVKRRKKVYLSLMDGSETSEHEGFKETYQTNYYAKASLSNEKLFDKSVAGYTNLSNNANKKVFRALRPLQSKKWTQSTDTVHSFSPIRRKQSKGRKAFHYFQELRSSESKFTLVQGKTRVSSNKLDTLPLLSEIDLVTFVTNYSHKSNHTQLKPHVVQPQLRKLLRGKILFHVSSKPFTQSSKEEVKNLSLKNSLKNVISLPPIPVLPPLTPYFNKTSFAFSASVSAGVGKHRAQPNKSYLSTVQLRKSLLNFASISKMKSIPCIPSLLSEGIHFSGAKDAKHGSMINPVHCFVSQGNKSSYFVTEKRRLQNAWIQKKRAYLIYLNEICSVPFTQQFTKGTKEYAAEAFTNFISSTNLQLSMFRVLTSALQVVKRRKGVRALRPLDALRPLQSKECTENQLFPGQLVAYGDNIASNIVTTESGQVLYIDSQKTTIRKAQTVLIYSQAIIAVLSGDWIKKGTPLMSLSYQKLVTGDIVQGLPKIEQFFEAPVLRDGTFWSDSLQAKLNQFFQEEREKLPLAEAVRKGFSEIQRVLVEGVLRVYISQGVLIADKHLEVIVRQMTCKGRILYSGDTGFLRNELVSLDKIENVNQVTYGQKALYHPQVRGITDASLESESFLSAASFQETTRVLSRDAIIGKTDLMRGLKERVIVGELIQAGTGLANNSVYNLLAHSFASEGQQ